MKLYLLMVSIADEDMIWWRQTEKGALKRLDEYVFDHWTREFGIAPRPPKPEERIREFFANVNGNYSIQEIDITTALKRHNASILRKCRRSLDRENCGHVERILHETIRCHNNR